MSKDSEQLKGLFDEYKNETSISQKQSIKSIITHLERLEAIEWVYGVGYGGFHLSEKGVYVSGGMKLATTDTMIGWAYGTMIHAKKNELRTHFYITSISDKLLLLSQQPKFDITKIWPIKPDVHFKALQAFLLGAIQLQLYK